MNEEQINGANIDLNLNFLDNFVQEEINKGKPLYD
jgi:hypothetical protein